MKLCDKKRCVIGASFVVALIIGCCYYLPLLINSQRKASEYEDYYPFNIFYFALREESTDALSVLHLSLAGRAGLYAPENPTPTVVELGRLDITDGQKNTKTLFWGCADKRFCGATFTLYNKETGGVWITSYETKIAPYETSIIGYRNANGFHYSFLSSGRSQCPLLAEELSSSFLEKYNSVNQADYFYGPASYPNLYHAFVKKCPNYDEINKQTIFFEGAQISMFEAFSKVKNDFLALT